MPHITILTAVYNAADTLPRCLDSLLGQTLADIEVICIDDASTDASPAILDGYARRDSRVRVIHLATNGGQARARNAGLAQARGEYIGMVDADDWLAPDALQQAWDVTLTHPDADAVLFHLIRTYPDGHEEPFYIHRVSSESHNACFNGRVASEENVVNGELAAHEEPQSAGKLRRSAFSSSLQGIMKTSFPSALASSVGCQLSIINSQLNNNCQLSILNSQLNNSWSGPEAMRLSLTWQIHGLYIVRSSIHHAYPYDDSARLYSDDNTTRLHYLHSRRVYASAGRYYYYQNPRSTTQRVTPLYFQSLIAQHHMRQLLEAEGIDAPTLAWYDSYRWLQLIDNCYYLRLHRRSFSRAERRDARTLIRHTWHTFPRAGQQAPLPAYPRKFGYRHCPTYPLFRCQEALYFTLRLLLRGK